MSHISMLSVSSGRVKALVDIDGRQVRVDIANRLKDTSCQRDESIMQAAITKANQKDSSHA